MLDAIGQSQYITTLDLAKGYWQVPLAEEDKEKTAFTSPLGLLQFRVMPFGLSGAPVTFQRLMDTVLRGSEEYTGVYLDDVVIHGTEWGEHLQNRDCVSETTGNRTYLEAQEMLIWNGKLYILGTSNWERGSLTGRIKS